MIEVYCLYSYFEFQEDRFSDGMLYQKRATKISCELYGEESITYLTRLQ